MGCTALDTDYGFRMQGPKNRIFPGTIVPGAVETYNDHRMAMAFTLIGLRVDGIIIKDYLCCKKTFENYFEIIDKITDIK